MTTEELLVSRFNLYVNKFCIFAGAGISVCSNIPLATVDLPGLPSIVTNIKRDFYNSLGNPARTDSELDAWFEDQKLLQQPNSLYSDALNLIGDTPRSRQHYLRKFFEDKTPSIVNHPPYIINSLPSCKRLIPTKNPKIETSVPIKNFVLFFINCLPPQSNIQLKRMQPP